jgi:methionyl aminopeptidase
MIIFKNKKQIKGIRKSCQLAKKTLDYIRPYVKAGVTTGYLNELMEKFIRDHGATPAPLGYKGSGKVPYPAATCISVNEVICHGIPGSYSLRNGDILNIDVTTILDGYYGDTSSMYTVGEISPEAQHLIKITKECLDVGIKQVRPGNHIGDIGYAINKHATSNSCSTVIQFCGHGVGFFFSRRTSDTTCCSKGLGSDDASQYDVHD